MCDDLERSSPGDLPVEGPELHEEGDPLTWNSTGPAGTAGKDGTTILSGAAKPSKEIGKVGDYYIDTASHVIYGPAVRVCPPYPCTTGWGGGTSLVGPPGKSATAALPYAYQTMGGTVQLPNGDNEDIVEQTIPVAGSYSVIATVNLDNTSDKGTAFYCELDWANPDTAGFSVDSGEVDDPGTFGSSTGSFVSTLNRMTLTGLVTVKANATITLQCGEDHAQEKDQVDSSQIISTQLSGFSTNSSI